MPRHPAIGTQPSAPTPRQCATIVRHPRRKMTPTATTLKFLQALADGDPEAEAEFYDDRAEFEATFGEYDREGIG